MPNSIINKRLLMGGEREFIYAETLNYINATQAERVHFGRAVDLLVQAIKTNVSWSKFKFGILCPVTLNDTLTVIDLKTATALSGAAIKGNTDTGVRSQMTTPLPIGFYMKQTGDYIKTGAIPTSLHTVNNTCIAHGILENVTGSTSSAYGSRQGASNTLRFVPRTAGDSCISDCYAETAGAGRNTLGGGTISDASGRWLQNRRNATDIEVYKSGASIGTAANGGGGLSNIEMFVGGFNSAGTPTGYLNHICTYHLQFEGLTATERNNLETALSNYEANLGNLRTLTRNLVWDGNSLNVYDNMGVIRKASFYAYSANKKLYRTRTYAVAGKTLSTMNTNYAAGPATQYNAAYTKNIYVIDEIRNDIVAGTAVATVKATLDTLVAAAQATGFTVIVNNVRFSDNGGALSDTDFNLRMDEMATYITANSFGADYIVEVNNTNLWQPRSAFASDGAYNTAIDTAIANTTYFTDAIHGTPEYYRIMGENVATQALNLIG